MPYNPNDYTRCEKCKHIDRENEKCKVTNDNWLVSDRAGTCHQFEGVESMWVQAKQNIGFKKREITKGRVYKVKRTFNGKISIKNDVNQTKDYFINYFKILEDEIEKPIQTAKEFEEQMEKVGELASKCSISGEELFNNPIKPNHYQAGEFDVIAFCFKHNLDFATGNIIKYVTRAGKKDKDKTLEDLEKAKEYLERKIEWVKANV